MSSLPFLVVLDMCTTLARFDFGIVSDFYCGVVCEGKFLKFQMLFGLKVFDIR